MNPIEEIPHLRSAFRQMDGAGKMNLVAQVRDVAIKYLEPLKARIQRHPISDHARTAYEAKGISLKWNLANNADAIAFSFAARGYSKLSVAQRKYFNRYLDLLNVCSRALEEETLSDIRQEAVLSAYLALDIPGVDMGEKQRNSQTENAKNPRSAKFDNGETLNGKIKQLAKNYPNEFPMELWERFCATVDELAFDCEVINEDVEIPYIWYKAKDGSRPRTMNFQTFGRELSKCKK